MPAPTPEQREYAELLLERASSDLAACRVLMADGDMLDDVVGFHAQQAMEKALKVALVLADIDFPRSHDLRELADIAADNHLEVPEAIKEARWLSPWAAQLRYEMLEPLDRDAARTINMVIPDVLPLSSVKAHLSEVVDRVELDQERVVLTP